MAGHEGWGLSGKSESSMQGAAGYINFSVPVGVLSFGITFQVGSQLRRAPVSMTSAHSSASNAMSK